VIGGRALVTEVAFDDNSLAEMRSRSTEVAKRDLCHPPLGSLPRQGVGCGHETSVKGNRTLVHAARSVSQDVPGPEATTRSPAT
jgi:hypothetical protein